MDYNFKIIDAVMEVNQIQKVSLVQKVKAYFGDDLKGMKFALWGLAFKPETDDIREAPSIYIINELIKAGAQIIAFDPEANTNVQNTLGNKIEYAENAYDALQWVDSLLIATEWAAFRNPDFSKMKSIMKNPIIFDGRNLFDLYSMEKRGFYYQSIGRRTINNLNK